ncbi:Phosphoribosylaminoimidazolesuccinocarboxamide (SAICAR) synthase, partial [Candidatus Regiella insecticola 5.15]
LNHPLFELFLKNDQLHDPIVSEAYCKAFGWVSEAHLVQMKKLSYQVNDVLSKLFDDAGLILVDFKLEFGLFEIKSPWVMSFPPMAVACGIKRR